MFSIPSPQVLIDSTLGYPEYKPCSYREAFLVGLSKYRSAIHALSLFIHYRNYAQRIPNVGPGLVLGEAYIQKDFWVSLQESLYSGGAFIFIQGCTVLTIGKSSSSYCQVIAGFH